MEFNKIGFGGGCHWCTEAVFQILKGVIEVEQGWISSDNEQNAFSEAVIVHFNSQEISLKTLIEVQLYTHSSTSNHSMRKKYRSAIYTFGEEQPVLAKAIITDLQHEFENKLITKVLPFVSFKSSPSEIQNYYKKNPLNPFCKKYINPKLDLILKKFSKNVSSELAFSIAKN